MFKLDRIDTSFPGFDFRDERLWFVHPVGDIHLCKTRLFAGFSKPPEKISILAGKGRGHRPTVQLRFEISQNRLLSTPVSLENVTIRERGYTVLERSDREQTMNSGEMSPFEMSLPHRLNLLSRFGGNPPLNLVGYRVIMGKPNRHYLLHAVVTTRSYREGLDIATELLRLNEAYRAKLRPDEYRIGFIFLNYFLLEVLDKMDRWEEYLDVWNRLRSDTKVVSLSAVDSHSETQLPEAFDYLLRVTSYRKDLIERKLRRKRAGRKLGNLMHHRQEDLSPEEIEDRLLRTLRWSISAATSGSRRIRYSREEKKLDDRFQIVITMRLYLA